MNMERQEPSPVESDSEELPEGGSPDRIDGGSNSHVALGMDIDISDQVEYIKRLFVERTDKYLIPQLESLYTRVIKGVFETRKGGKDDLKQRILSFLSKYAEDVANFWSQQLSVALILLLWKEQKKEEIDRVGETDR